MLIKWWNNSCLNLHSLDFFRLSIQERKEYIKIIACQNGDLNLSVFIFASISANSRTCIHLRGMHL
jgi:hypothetical protein